jgi:hypothetical protein
MRDLLGLVFDAVVFGVGSLGAGYVLWQVNTYVRRAGALSPHAAGSGASCSVCVGALWQYASARMNS